MQALALKYRPKNFKELIGQESVSQSLAHALDERRISHAYLFSGLRGSGKTSSARIFSKALVCEHGPTSTPCETCAHCIMANESRHIDIIEMDAASNRKIDDIRDLIEQTKYAPASARYKIFIIDEVHMLTKEAFNALLKTLEEPPSYVKFILATTDPLKLPATVLSRTQHFRFKQIARFDVLKQLRAILENEQISYENEALEIITRSGSGSLRDTLTLLDQAIIYCGGDITKTKTASMLGLLDPSRIEEILDIVLRADRDALRTIMAQIESYEPEMIIDELVANLREKFALNDPRISVLMYERFLRILAQAKTMLNVTSDNGFVLSVMLFMMIEALGLMGIDDAIEQARAQNASGGVNFTHVNASHSASSKQISTANTPNLAQNPTHQTSVANASSQIQVQTGQNFNAGSVSNMPTTLAKQTNHLDTKEQENSLKNGEFNAEKSSLDRQDTSEQTHGNNEISTTNQNMENSQPTQNQVLYNEFLVKIYDRDFTLGDCFKRSVSFVGFDGETLSLASWASGADREMLRARFGVISTLCKAVFGEHSKIDVQKKDAPTDPLELELKNLNRTANTTEKKTTSNQNSAPTQTNLSQREQILTQEPQNSHQENTQSENFTQKSEFVQDKDPTRQTSENTTQAYQIQNDEILSSTPHLDYKDQNLKPTNESENSHFASKDSEQQVDDGFSGSCVASAVFSPNKNVFFEPQLSDEKREELRKNAILSEARALFGEPEIQKI